jgi:hypothetical protein
VTFSTRIFFNIFIVSLSLIEILRDDMVYQELLKQTEAGEAKPLPRDEDLPGMGQFYCLHCELVFYFNISFTSD